MFCLIIINLPYVCNMFANQNLRGNTYFSDDDIMLYKFVVLFYIMKNCDRRIIATLFPSSLTFLSLLFCFFLILYIILFII